jgi:hypothetical protein
LQPTLDGRDQAQMCRWWQEDVPVLHHRHGRDTTVAVNR